MFPAPVPGGNSSGPDGQTDRRAGAEPGPRRCRAAATGGRPAPPPCATAPRPQARAARRARSSSRSSFPFHPSFPSARPWLSSPVCPISPPIMAVVLVGTRSSPATLFLQRSELDREHPRQGPAKQKGRTGCFFGCCGVCTSLTHFFPVVISPVCSFVYMVPAELCQKR